MSDDSYPANNSQTWDPRLESREILVFSTSERLDPDAPPPPPFRVRRWYLLPVVLFLVTCWSTVYVGGWVYAASLMTILGCHEAGHFLQARRHRVYASLPFFIPMPFSIIGTFGAVIGMDPRIGHRKALFDIGITGPLAGLVPTLICCFVGLQFSHVGPIHPRAMEFGEPILFKLLGWLQFGPMPPGCGIYLHPVAMAGWVGLLITALNLFPVGQLDGGHVLYVLLGRRAHRVAMALLVGAWAAAVLYYWWWMPMLFLLILIGPKHPPTRQDDVPLGTPRAVLGWLTLAFLLVGFTPEPIMM